MKFAITIFIVREHTKRPCWSLEVGTDFGHPVLMPGFFKKLKVARAASEALANAYRLSGYDVTIMGVRI